jgi:hypothetical protein
MCLIELLVALITYIVVFFLVFSNMYLFPRRIAYAQKRMVRETVVRVCGMIVFGYKNDKQ